MTQDTDVTIKELAEKLGISKQAVRRYFDQLPPSLLPIKKKGTYFINAEAQEFITDRVLKVDTKVDSKIDSDDTNVDIKIDSRVGSQDLSDLILIQKDFIDDKNKQINSLNKQIDRLHTLLDQQQQLTLQNNKQIEKLQFQLDSKENNMLKKDNEEEQHHKIVELTNELDKKNIENEHLKEELSQLKESNKKGFWKRLFQS